MYNVKHLYQKWQSKYSSEFNFQLSKYWSLSRLF